MPTVFEIKEQPITDTPLLLIECRLRDGQTERWSTHRAEDDGQVYEARVLRHNVFEMQTAADQGVDGIPRVVLTLANADSHFSQVERTVGWKGAHLTVRFGLFDLATRRATTEVTTLFQGIANSPDEITERTFRMSATNRMNLQRATLPQVRLQRRCPWEFPANLQQREEAATGGPRGEYSRFFRCGYSPDVENGTGSLNNGEPFTQCRFTRADCEARGMFRVDTSNRETRRFGGCEFVPSSITVRSYGEKSSHLSPVIGSEGRYNDAIPLVYGTAWYTPPVVFARNDGNLTHMEVLLGIGEVEAVLKVLVNDVEIAEGRAGANMSGSGWFNLISRGNRTGTFNSAFTKATGVPAGDPYGSMAYLSVAVPNRLNDGRTLPSVKVLLKGLRLPHYDEDGVYCHSAFTNNPAWILLDVLMRAGWSQQELDLQSFARTAAYCEELIGTEDMFGNAISIPRFQCNLALAKRRSIADVVRGIRNAARLFLTYGFDGRLQASVENTIAAQQTEKPMWTNAAQLLNGGWASYEFDESSILRRSNGEPAIRLWSRPTSDTPNRYSVEFQDELNEFQQDSLSLVDTEDIAATGQEVSGTLQALGIANFDQASRLLKYNLDRSIQGNTYIEFDTSLKAIGIQPGDLITITYLKEGLQRQPFRVLKMSASGSLGRFQICAQIHRDEWYSDTNGQSVWSPGGRRQAQTTLGTPRPLGGNKSDPEGRVVFEIDEALAERGDGGAEVQLTVGFAVPRRPSMEGPSIPLLSLAAQVNTEGGNLEANRTFYYAATALDADGNESPLSFIVRAATPDSTNSNSVTLTNLRFSAGTSGYHVYRGSLPEALHRIATVDGVAGEFVDIGLPAQLDVPADPNFDHANFYWRFEVAPAMPATVHSKRTIGNSTLALQQDQWRGMAVRIDSGRGEGQERVVTQNTDSLLTLDRDWVLEPDGTSMFTVSEAAWRFGATAQTSPVNFEAPNRAGAVVQVCGRAANPINMEAAYELSTVTRWVIGGGNWLDEGLPPQPTFGIEASPTVPGAVEITGIAFSDLTNTRSISAAKLTLYYVRELSTAEAAALTVVLGAEDDVIQLDASSGAEPGSMLQAGFELMRIEDALEDGHFRIERGVGGTGASTHDIGESVHVLDKLTTIQAFPRDFFGSAASGSWRHTIAVPDVRIAAAEMIMVNANGEGEATFTCLTGTQDLGLRTLSGGQITFQLEGFAAIEDGAAPEWYVDASHAVRDVFAFVRAAPTGSPLEVRLYQGSTEYCTLQISPGSTMSQIVDGFDRGPIWEGQKLGLDILAVGLDTPGSDLTVVIRL